VKKIFGVKPFEAVLFIVFAVVYTGLQLWWSIAVSRNPSAFLPSVAGQNPTGINNMAILLFVLATSLLYAVIGSVIGGKTEGVSPLASFLMRIGVALMIFSSVGQVASVFVPTAFWTYPAEGIPVLRTLTIAVSLGIFLAGVGGNMVWVGERRQAFFAESGGKKKR
jgi:hypothetical protein